MELVAPHPRGRARHTPLSLQRLEDRVVPGFADLSAYDQLLVELINRARAEPLAEAARHGIDLNEGLPPGTISPDPKPPLAPHQALITAAGLHSDDMLARNFFAHTNPDGLGPGHRTRAAGWAGGSISENLSWGTSYGSQTAGTEERHRSLFRSTSGHRQNMLDPAWDVVGTGVTFGSSPYRSLSFPGTPVSLATENFGDSGQAFITGVVFDDRTVDDDFYTPGEGLGGVTVTAVSASDPAVRFSTTTADAGGYALAVPAGVYTVTVSEPGFEQPAAVAGVTVGGVNVKVDFVPDGSRPPSPPPAPPAPPPPLGAPRPGAWDQARVGLFAAAPGGRGAGPLRVLGPDGSTVVELTRPGGLDSPGGSRAAVADITGDGVPDLAAAAGPGGTPRVVVLDGATWEVVFSADVFEPSFRGGVFLAAGDVDGDGAAELAVTPDQGGGPRVRLFRGRDFAVLADFLGIEDPGFRGGARPAFGTFSGGRADLLVAAGFGGGPRVAGYAGSALAEGRAEKLFADFFVFEPALRNGAYLTAGDLDGDGTADLIAGGGPGGAPRVLALSGRDLIDSFGATRTELANFFAGDPSGRGGVRVAAKDLDRDAYADLVTGAGDGSAPVVRRFAGASVVGNPDPAPLGEQLAFAAGFTGGVFVG